MASVCKIVHRKPARAVRGQHWGEHCGEGGAEDDRANKYHVRIARGSLYETKHWLRRAYRRDLISEAQVEELKPLLDELAPRLNAYLNSIGR
jgi:four helix bundle protein